MGFFDKRLGPATPPPPPPTLETVAPGAWWMGPPLQQPQAQSTSYQQQAQNIDLSMPVPANNPEDLCPVCGEYSYLEFQPDYSYGGPAQRGKARMCMDCHGPGGGTSQGVAKSGSAIQQNVSGVETLKVRTTGSVGSWALQDKSQSDGYRQANGANPIGGVPLIS